VRVAALQKVIAHTWPVSRYMAHGTWHVTWRRLAVSSLGLALAPVVRGPPDI
jgi:hypothetical protein